MCIGRATPRSYCLPPSVEILQHPENVTVFLNQSAVFTCVTRGGISYWIVNGIPTESGTRDDFNVSPTKKDGRNLSLTLTVQAKEEHNGTIIQCGVAILNVGSLNSTDATLLIQGIYCMHYKWQKYAFFVFYLFLLP